MKQLLDDILFVFNTLHNQKIRDLTTYDLAKRIENLDFNSYYKLVEWPESQMLMEEDWFNECFLGKDSSYFVPINRIK